MSLIDQFLSVKHPLKFHFRKKFKYQSLALFIIFIILAFLDAPYFIDYDMYFYINETTQHCTTANAEIHFYISASNSFLSAIIPFVLMVLFSVSIGHYLIKNRKNFQIRKKLKKEVRIIKLWLSISLFFLICTLPFYIQLLVHDLLSFNNPEYFFLNPLFEFLFSFTWQFSYVPNSFEFFVCLSTNKVFRNYFFSLIKFRKNSVQPVVTVV